MKIKQVSYRRLWNLGNYENVAIELAADVATDEMVDEVLHLLEGEAVAWYKNRKRSGGAS